MEPEWSKKVALTRDVCGSIRLSKLAQEIMRPELPVRAFLSWLVQGKLYADAICVLAYRMPKRYAVWWGCLCARHAGGHPLPPVQEAALQAAVRWVLDPNEEQRRAAEAPGVAATLQTSAGCVARAVFWSGGSLLPAHSPVTPPAPTMTAQAIAGGILTAAAEKAGNLKANQAELLAIGFQVSHGSLLWH